MRGAISCNQTQSGSVGRYPQALRRNQERSEAITGNHRQSQAITGNHRQSQAITGNHRQSQAITGNHRQSQALGDHHTQWFHPACTQWFHRHALSGFIGMHSVVSLACVRVLKVLILRRERPLEGGDVAIRHAESVIRAVSFTLACAGIARLRPLGARPIQKVAAGVMAPRERLDFGLVHLMREAID